MKKNSKGTKHSLLMSLLSLLLCLSMLVGTTFAWFTDSVISGINVIAAGNLDVNLYHTNAAAVDQPVKIDTELFRDLQGDPILWEPGVVSYENLRIANEGDLALTYRLSMVTENENYILDPVTGDAYGLSQALKVGFVAGGVTGTDRASVVASVEEANWTTLSAFLREGSLLPEGNGESEQTWGVVIWWQPGDNDNRWNLNNGKTLTEGEVLSIDLGIKLVATQMTSETDSFDNAYDSNAKAELFSGFQGGAANTVVTADDGGLTTDEVAMNGGDVSAVIPAGVHVAEGTNTLALSVSLKDASEANIQLSESEEMRPLDVHIAGVAAGNTVPMLITLNGYLSAGINAGALKLYHVENGATVPMTQVANPVNHNEFSYDPITGDVTLALASFSEVAVVADNNNTWDGKTETAYTGSGTKENPYLIATADQLAYFRTQVDNGNSFAGKFVKLNNNIYLSNVNFDPIGWGYVNASHNRNGVAGKVFMGTFDGNNKTIYDLYQSGWDLEETTGTDYTYTNCGFGLFAAASGATFKNLTMYGAYVRVECVETGILVGLSQNDCVYENIKIYNSKAANYQRPVGGLIGEVSGDGTTTITNVIIGSDVVVGSLWGDFDAPCGGVIGARWDDVDADPQIVMEKVDVGCRMDVYNDVTSAYQWHAYRRAGMLIGNTDTPEANGKTAQTATADFLTCKYDDNGEETVIVRVGSWANYHYCEFSEEYNSPRYPWVRVEAGENNPAYSNPRWGVATDAADQPVTNEHTETTHTGDDQHNIPIAFAQLYGGGQGVYGATAHPGVKMDGYRYSIIYMNNDKVLSIQYVTDEMAQKTVPFIPNDTIAKETVMEWVKAQGYTNVVFDAWVSAGSKKLEIPADNTENIIAYPSFTTPYTARFVDLDGNVLAWCFFNKDKSDIAAAEQAARALLPEYANVGFQKWEAHYYDSNNNAVTEDYNASKFTGSKCYTTDVTIYPVYQYNGKLNLVPVDSDGDGKTNYYRVEAIAELDETTVIPGYVLGIQVKEVVKLYKNDGNFDYGSGVKTIIIEEGIETIQANALAHTNDLNTVKLPSTLKTLGKNAFSRNFWYNVLGKKDTKVLTIEYNGTKAEWDAIQKDEDWANGLKEGSIIKCTDGYYEATKVGTGVTNHTWTWKTY